MKDTHTHMHEQKIYGRTPPHSSRVRTFVLAGPQKNADKADIIFGLLQGLRACVHVRLNVLLHACVCTYIVRSIRADRGILGVSGAVKSEQK